MSVNLYACPSVCPSGLERNAIFLAPYWDRVIIFSVHIPLTYEVLFYKYFICRSLGQATKGRNVKIWKLIFSVPNENKQLVFFYAHSFLFSYKFLIISNSFASYRCCHPYLILNHFFQDFCTFLTSPSQTEKNSKFINCEINDKYSVCT